MAKLFGDWNKIPEVVTLGVRFQKAVDKALLQEGHRLRGDIVKGIASGAPGGKQFAPLSPITLAIRKAKGFGGSKPLNVSGTLRGSITVKRLDGAVFVGLLRASAATNVGAIHEFGRTWTQTVTAKSRRFFFAMLKKANGSGTRDAQGRYLKRGSGGGGLIGPRLKGGAFRSKTGTVTISIPARPFIGPVFEAERDQIVSRFWESVAKSMGGDLLPR